jgi:hypothetical protein
VEVFAGIILWVFFGGMVPETAPVAVWVVIAAIGLTVGVFGKWRLSEADTDKDNCGRKHWYSVIRHYNMFGNEISPLFLVIITHVFTISGTFYAMVSIYRLW